VKITQLSFDNYLCYKKREKRQ